MQVTNIKTVGKLIRTQLWVSILLLILVGISYFDSLENFHFNEKTFLRSSIFAGIAVFFYLCFLIYFSLRKYNYVYFSDEDNNLVFRFYKVSVLSKKFKSIVIAKQQFGKYEIVKTFYEKNEQLILFQKVQNKIMKYPPISITALSKEEKEKIKSSLNKYTQIR